MATALGLHEGRFGAHNNFTEWKIYMESHIASVDNISHDCRGILKITLEGKRSRTCNGNLGLH